LQPTATYQSLLFGNKLPEGDAKFTLFSKFLEMSEFWGLSQEAGLGKVGWGNIEDFLPKTDRLRKF
jgi:hypothetical protein